MNDSPETCLAIDPVVVVTLGKQNGSTNVQNYWQDVQCDTKASYICAYSNGNLYIQWGLKY